MLRPLALALLLANGLYFAWAHGLLWALGLAPAQQSEPQHMAQQIAPDTVRLLSAQEFKQMEEQAQADQSPKECLQAGPFTEAQSAVLRKALGDSLPADAWSLEETHIAPRWIVYLGKFASAEALAKKRSELAAMNLTAESPLSPDLEPGLSLAAFDTRAEADAALVQVSAHGLRTARVVQEHAQSGVYLLRLPAMVEALQSKLAEVRTAMGSKGLHACK